MITIPEFYEGKSIFLTGGSGFIGKVLIEKVLRSCPGVGDIYILMRPKRGQSVQERITDLIKCKVFDNLKKDQPNFAKKLIAIAGDMMDEGLGISQSDLRMLEENVHIVFHSAATIKFDEPLKLALQMNLVGVRKMIQICRPFKNLLVFVHISTAYANCDRSHIDEIVYPPPVEPNKILAAAEWMDDETVALITQKLIGGKPNTYTYTKHLAEYLLLKEGGDLPLAIVRPSIVTAAWNEPFPGWVDNLNGPSGMTIAAGKGLLKSIRADVKAVADIVPVDFPVNMVLAVGWFTAVTKPEKCHIYNCTTGAVNPFTWGEMEPLVLNFFKKNPLEDCFRRPNCVLTGNSFLHNYWVFVSHMIPAYLTDMCYMLIGKRPRIVRIYKKMHHAMGILEFFINKQWTWTCNNSDMLNGQMSEQDRKTFLIDAREIQWHQYMENYCAGTKKFILNEDPSGLPAARAHLKKLRNIRYFTNTVVIIALWRLLIARSQIARNLWMLIMNLVFRFVRSSRITSTVRK